MEMASAQQPAAPPGVRGNRLLPPPEGAMGPAVDELIDRVRADTAEEVARLQARFPQARTMVREGSPRPMILHVAAEVKADLIVVGTHGRTGLAHVLFGSVAAHVVRHSRIPVLPGREAEGEI